MRATAASPTASVHAPAALEWHHLSGSAVLARMHPLVSLLGAFAGVKAMGLIGVLVGPLVLTLFLELLALHETELASNGPTEGSSFPAST